jgi:hypothetical protein
MLIPPQNSNKANCKIQDFFPNRQIKEDVKCNNNKYRKLYYKIFIANYISLFHFEGCLAIYPIHIVPDKMSMDKILFSLS